MKIGYLGPRGTFSYEACKRYNEESELKEYKTITETILGLKNDEVDEIIVPIENSIQGGVTETIDTLIEVNEIYVKTELVLDITQNLMANKKYSYDEIKHVYSHPQALAQSRNFIEKNLKNADIIQVSSTALSAKEIQNKDNCACIANISCAKEYNLTVIEENIQDNNFNKTKFWVLSKIVNKEGNKMSIIFSTQNKPGALYEILGLFNENKINMTKIESRPAKTVLGEYIFLVDIEYSENVISTLEKVKAKCRFFKNLGIY